MTAPDAAADTTLTSPTHLSGRVIAGIRARVPSLIPSEARVAATILEDPDGVIHQSVTEVAAAAGAAVSTVVRCCQHLGFKGFQDLKIALARDSIPSVRRLQADITDDDGLGDVMQKVFAASADALRESIATLEVSEFERAVHAIRDAQRLLLVGVGTSAPLAQDAAYRFLTIGVHAESPPDVHVQHVSAQLLTRRDVCLAVSHTGATRETLACVRSAVEVGATTIAVTSFSHSPLTDLAEIVLVAGSREISFRVEAMSSRIAHLTVLDALLVGVALGTRSRAIGAQDATAAVLSDHRY
jgi:DNA-binding MurR/RpiR family transcriptional regulator